MSALYTFPQKAKIVCDSIDFLTPHRASWLLGCLPEGHARKELDDSRGPLATDLQAIRGRFARHSRCPKSNVCEAHFIGVEISRATMDGWVMQVGEMLRPLVEGMGRELVQGTYLQADETPIDVQMHDGRRRNHKAFLWQYGRPGGATVFDFRLGRERAGPKRFLENFHGLLQTDAYQAYDKVAGSGMVHAGCWTHARLG
jgi:hypothetical protein